MTSFASHPKTCDLWNGGSCTCPPGRRLAANLEVLPAKTTSSDVAAANPRPKMWRATDLAAGRRVEWLANRRIVAGATNYMLGPEGIGKSLFLTWLTAIVTTGRSFPEFGCPARAPHVVVLVLTEDDWATIARPRLEVAGADLDFVRVICAEEDGSGSPVFPEDMAVVEAAAAGAAVVIVDAWADTLPGNLSVKDPQQARQALHPWKELATRTGVAVLLSGHTNREKGGNVRNVYGLSGEIRKKARMTLLAQPDQEDDGVLVIGPEKSNVTAPVPASRFRIEAVPVFPATEDSDGTVPRLVWIGDSDQSARDFFADAFAAEQGDGTEDRNDVDDWLRAFLATGSVKATEVYSAADANGYSKDQIKRSKKRIGAAADRPSNPGPWVWSLPGPNHGAGRTDRAAPPVVLPALPVLSASQRGCSREQSAQGAGSRETGSTSLSAAITPTTSGPRTACASAASSIAATVEPSNRGGPRDRGVRPRQGPQVPHRGQVDRSIGEPSRRHRRARPRRQRLDLPHRMVTGYRVDV
ncbi:AAA domain-containing protein [Modestobacter sp. DSM 44400]|uniref:AAA family ATPase n=1 Tax=Modestobacter sp. DSM 44400 TaxID=1550230 RepID=UPI000898D1DB|nr:AAA family ATPase [Modestobacter sp. DSM 44400]SDY26544.1 AAA domain-containing protein [Modestobacter sp. DSM 44400]